MRAVITGAAGFIGSHLVERLVGDGWHVTGVDAFTSYYASADKEANLADLASEPRFDLVRDDVVAADLQRLFVDKPVVIHLSGQPGVRGSFGDGFQRYVHDNILATQRVFDAAHVAGCRRVVYASSSSVYGDAAMYPCRESSTPTLPRSPYGVTKRTCEKLAEVYRALGLEAVGLRYFTVYGPRQRPDMAIRRLCEAATGGERFRLNGDGEQSRDFTYVEDAVDATIRAATAEDPGDLLNVGGGHEATMNEVVEMIGDLAGAPVPITAGRPQPGDVRRTGSDTTRARRRLGWTPRTNLAEGLRAQLDWVRALHATRTADDESAVATATESDELELALGRAS
jgi:nucleoside-diphosphate-sugar epimerase